MSVAINETVGTSSHLTIDEFQALPNEKDFELVDGQLMEQQMGFESSYIAGHLLALLYLYSQSHRLGWVVGSDCGYSLPLPGRTGNVRRPDVSFVSFDKLSVKDGIPRGYPAIAPDLAAEVLSPNDLAYEVDAKIKDYLEAGVKLIWIINPASRSAQVLRQDGSTARLLETDSLDGETVLPGFQCRIATLFEVPQPKQ